MSRSGYSQNLLFQVKAAKLPAPTPEYQFHPVRRWRLDLAWPDQKLYVEVDGGTWVGGRHSRGAGYENDCVKLAEAAILGWRGIRVTTGMVKSGQALGFIERMFQWSSCVASLDAASDTRLEGTVSLTTADGRNGATPTAGAVAAEPRS